MSFALYYASKTIMHITQVRMLDEQQTRKWFAQASQWSDIVRVRMTNEATGEVIKDDVFEYRILEIGEPDREEKVRELVERMDTIFVAERQFVQRSPSETVVQKLTVSRASSERCVCGDLRIEHAGSDSSGRCQACRPCQRFRRRP